MIKNKQAIQAYKEQKSVKEVLANLYMYMSGKAEEIVEVERNTPRVEEFSIIEKYWREHPIVSDYYHFDEELFLKFSTIFADGYPHLTASLSIKEGEDYEEVLSTTIWYSSFSSDAKYLTNGDNTNKARSEMEFQTNIRNQAIFIYENLQNEIWKN